MWKLADYFKQKHIKMPAITGVYDPVTHRRDGIVTSRAPIVVTGSNLLYSPRHYRLCLVDAADKSRVIDVPMVYKYLPTQLIVLLPPLDPGEYHPALKLTEEGENAPAHAFSIRWKVER